MIPIRRHPTDDSIATIHHRPISASLDLVYSYARASTAYGSNVTPSFLNNHLLAPSADTTDDEDRDRQEEDDRSFDEDDEDEEEHLSAIPEREQLPPNAVQNNASPSESSPLLMPRRSYTKSTYTLNNDARSTFNGSLRIRRSNGTASRRRRSSVAASVLSNATTWKDIVEEAIEEGKGSSTEMQTLFNLVNVLVGIGLLSLSLAFSEAGWGLGMFLLVFCALITNYTAKVLAKLMSRDNALQTYADVLIKAFGSTNSHFKTIIYLAFGIELTSLSIALVVLASDSLEVLYPSISSTTFKYLAAIVLLPSTYLPLRFLSISSLLGIISSISIIVILCIDGFSKQTAPGSILHPMPTSITPHWAKLPLSFGIMMAGFAGHAIVPSIYKDMATPTSFNRVVDQAYVITFIICLVVGGAGYLMFGDTVSSEITREMLETPGFPVVLNKIAMWMIAINPILKFALASSPLTATITSLLGVSPPPPPSSPPSHEFPFEEEEEAEEVDGRKNYYSTQAMIRPLLVFGVVGLAMIIPDFSAVMALLGSFSAVLICVVGPIGANLILDPPPPSSPSSTTFIIAKGGKRGEEAGDRMSRIERCVNWVLLGLGIVLGIVGTAFSLYPASAA